MKNNSISASKYPPFSVYGTRKTPDFIRPNTTRTAVYNNLNAVLSRYHTASIVVYFNDFVFVRRILALVYTHARARTYYLIGIIIIARALIAKTLYVLYTQTRIKLYRKSYLDVTGFKCLPTIIPAARSADLAPSSFAYNIITLPAQFLHTPADRANRYTRTLNPGRKLYVYTTIIISRGRKKKQFDRTAIFVSRRANNVFPTIPNVFFAPKRFR